MNLAIGDRVRVDLPEDYRHGKTGIISQIFDKIALVRMDDMFFVSLRSGESIPHSFWFRLAHLAKL